MDREIISKLEKEVQRTYSIKTTVFQNGEKVSEEINTHREPCVRISIEMADKILALLKEQEAVKPTWSRGRPFCGACGLRIRGGKFCSKCGKPILWEGRRWNGSDWV